MHGVPILHLITIFELVLVVLFLFISLELFGIEVSVLGGYLSL